MGVWFLQLGITALAPREAIPCVWLTPMRKLVGSIPCALCTETAAVAGPCMVPWSLPHFTTALKLAPISPPITQCSCTAALCNQKDKGKFHYL